jgi:hypothetical protein
VVPEKPVRSAVEIVQVPDENLPMETPEADVDSLKKENGIHTDIVSEKTQVEISDSEDTSAKAIKKKKNRMCRCC